MKMIYLFLLVMTLVGCSREVKPTVEVTPAYVDMVTSAVKATTTEVGEVKIVLQENTQILMQIKDLVQNPPTDGDVAQEPPSSPTLLSPSVIKLYVSSIPGCRPCRQLEQDDRAGKFAEAGFEVEYVDDPGWSGGYPIIRWVGDDGGWKGLMYQDRSGRYQSAGYGPGTIAELTRLLK
jgi:hypothetical protein